MSTSWRPFHSAPIRRLSSRARGHSLHRGRGGSDRFGAVPSNHPSKGHSGRSPRRCTWNKMEDIGSFLGGWGRATADRRGSDVEPTMQAGRDGVPISSSPSVSFVCGLETMPHPIHNGAEVLLQHRWCCHQNAVNTVGNTRSRRRLAEPTLSPISSNSSAHAPVGDNADSAWAIIFAPSRDHRQSAGPPSNSYPVHPFETRTAPQGDEGPAATRRDDSVPFDGGASRWRVRLEFACEL
jgi:ribosome modulation factor